MRNNVKLESDSSDELSKDEAFCDRSKICWNHHVTHVIRDIVIIFMVGLHLHLGGESSTTKDLHWHVRRPWWTTRSWYEPRSNLTSGS